MSRCTHVEWSKSRIDVYAQCSISRQSVRESRIVYVDVYPLRNIVVCNIVKGYIIGLDIHS